MKYLLDTNILSALMRSPNGVIAERLRSVEEDDVGTSIIVVAEVKYGIRKSGSKRLAQQYEKIESTLRVEPFSSPAEEQYARIRNETESIGLTVSQNDLLIAAHAQAMGAVLGTDDRIFLSIPGLKVENWLMSQP